MFDKETEERLFEFCKTHRLGLASDGDHSRLKLKDFKFHVTIMYSKVTSPDFIEGEFALPAPHVVRPMSYDLFGPDLDLLVIRLVPDAVLSGLFEHSVTDYGHVSDFMPFRPHVTIRGSSADIRDRLSLLPLPDFDLRAERVVQKVKES